MAAVMTRHPPLIPPPVYERDPETSSIISAAPSYVSDRPPTYSRANPTANNAASSGPPSAAESTTTLVDDSSPPEITQISTEPEPSTEHHGLPALRYAPGFTAPPRGNVRDIENHNYNIRSWSSIHTSHAARQYRNVAARRTSQASSTALMNSTAPLSPSTSSSSTASAASASSTNLSTTTSNTSTASTPPPPSPPLNPREDPALVGELAASRAKAQRLYREMCMRGDGSEGLKHESKTWDFMLSQMADWEERGRSWNKFRNEITAGKGRLGGKILGRKIALSGLRGRV